MATKAAGASTHAPPETALHPSPTSDARAAAPCNPADSAQGALAAATAGTPVATARSPALVRSTVQILCALCCCLEPLGLRTRLDEVLSAILERELRHLLATLHALRLCQFGSVQWLAAATIACEGASPDPDAVESHGGGGSGGNAEDGEAEDVGAGGEEARASAERIEKVAAAAAAGEGVAMLIHLHLQVRVC